MEIRQKRILSIIGFIAIVAVFSFSWLIFNGDKEKEPALASPNKTAAEDTVIKEQEESKVSMSESITLDREYDEDTIVSESEANSEAKNPPTTQPSTTAVGLGSNIQLKGQGYVKDGEFLEKSSFTFNGWDNSKPFSIGGMDYREGIGFNINYGSWNNQNIPVARYLLQGKYTKLTGSVGIDDESIDSKGQYRIDFFTQNLDNTVSFLHSTENIKAGNFALPFEIDVTNVQGLMIELVKLDTEDKRIQIALVDTKLE